MGFNCMTLVTEPNPGVKFLAIFVLYQYIYFS
jgi:hypothetical protein